MKNLRNNLLLAVVLGLSASPALADQAAFQLGYVFNSWTSNYISSGQEHRMPASLRFTTGALSLSADTSFLVGDYEKAVDDVDPATSFKPSELSDTTFAASVDFHLGSSILSTLSGQLNIPTGSTTWENLSESGSIPFLFEPSYYHGRGWGGSFFWAVSSTDKAFQWGLSTGYLLTTTYDVGIPGQSAFNPGDSLLAMGSLGGSLSETEKLGMRVIHTFPLESKVVDPTYRFTSPESTILAGQWLKTMGGDQAVLNISYSFYSRGYEADPLTLLQVREEQNFLGDRLEVRPSLGVQMGSGAALESSLVWKRIFANGYPSTDSGHYLAGGNLMGIEENITFRLASNVFLNFSGLYHLVIDEKAALDVNFNPTDVAYNRFTAGTNVGFKW